MKRLAIIVAAVGAMTVGCGFLTACNGSHAQGNTSMQDSKSMQDGSHSFWRYVDKSGDISRPSDETARDKWVHIGSWAIPKVKGASGPGIHSVYTQRWALKAFNRTHKWPDGAVLLKQIHAIHKGARTTGPKVYWAGKTGVWFVMVKDNKNRFPKDPRWANGWGWALFKADKPEKNISTRWDGKGLSNCKGCHIPAKNTGYVYLEGYPLLKLTEAQKKAAAKH